MFTCRPLAASAHAGPIFCSVRVRGILIVAPHKWLTARIIKVPCERNILQICNVVMFLHFPFHSHTNPSLVVLTGSEDITNKSRVSVYLDIILIIPPCPPDQLSSGVNIDLCSAGNTGEESRETVPCPSDDHRTLISDSLFADLRLLDIELWRRAGSLWKNDGLGKTQQCNSEFSNTLHKNWLHDKFCFVLYSNKRKSLLTILTITQRITYYKPSLLGVKWNIQ